MDQIFSKIHKEPPSQLSSEELNNALDVAVAFVKGDRDAGNGLREFFPNGPKTAKIPEWWYCQLAEETVQAGCVNDENYPSIAIKRLAKLIGSPLWYALAMAASHMGDEVGCRRVLEGIVNNWGVLYLNIFTRLQHRPRRDPAPLNLQILETLLPQFPNDGNTAEEILQTIEFDKQAGKTIPSERAGVEIWALLHEGLVEQAIMKVKTAYANDTKFPARLLGEILNKLADARMLPQMFDYARWREENTYALNIKDASILLKCCRESGDAIFLQQAVELVENMTIRPDAMLIQELLCAYEQLQQPEQARRVFAQAIQSGVRLGPYHYTTMIAVCGQEGKWAEAEDFFKRAKQISPDDHTIYGALLNAYGKAGQPEKAQAVFDQMRAAGIEPDNIRYGALIDAYGKVGQPENAQAIFDQMRAAGIEPNNIHYGALIDGYSKAGQPEKAQAIFDQMGAAGVSPNNIQYGALIDAYGKAGRPDDAQTVFDQMRAAGISPGNIEYGTLINAYGIAGRPEQAESILRNALKELSLSPKEQSYLYNLVIKGYDHSQRVEDVHRLKDEMIQKSLPIDQYTLGSSGHSYETPEGLQDERRAPRSREAEQWKELSTLLEDVIHELNQPVGVIGNATRTALNYVRRNETSNALLALEKLSGAVQELGERISVYKALTQRSRTEEVVQVRDLVLEVERLLHRQADNAKVKIDIDISDHNKWNRPLYWRGDPFLYRMAIRALIHNAVQACADPALSEDRRRIIIRGMYTPSGDLHNAPDGWIDLYVRDQGPGIPPEHRQRIFERGFTTKKGRGLGLGLSLVQSVADYYGGRIRLVEEVTPGVEFWFRLPAALPPNPEDKENTL